MIIPRQKNRAQAVAFSGRRCLLPIAHWPVRMDADAGAAPPPATAGGWVAVLSSWPSKLRPLDDAKAGSAALPPGPAEAAADPEAAGDDPDDGSSSATSGSSSRGGAAAAVVAVVRRREAQKHPRLRPDHSLQVWGALPLGDRPPLRPITMSEVAAHATPSDA